MEEKYLGVFFLSINSQGLNWAFLVSVHFNSGDLARLLFIMNWYGASAGYLHNLVTGFAPYDPIIVAEKAFFVIPTSTPIAVILPDFLQPLTRIANQK